MNVESGLQVDLLGAFKRRGKMAACVAGAVFLTSYWIAMALPNQFTSAATIFVEPQAISDLLISSGIGQSDLNRRLALMSAQILSRPRLSRVIDELSLYQKESSSMLREEVIELMRENISIQPVIPELATGSRRNRDEEINTFRVIFVADSARTAAAVAQRLANDFIKEHIEERVQMTQKSLEFIDAERTRLAARVKLVEDRISIIKGENAGRLPEDVSSNQRQLERTLSDLRSAERQYDSAKGEAAFWENQVLAASASEGSEGAGGPVRRLQTLEILLSEYRSRGYTEKHPDVVQVSLEIEGLKADLESNRVAAEQDAGRPEMSFAAQNAAASKKRAQMNVTAAKQDIDRLRAQAEEVGSRIEATPRVAAQLDALEREQKQLAGNLNDYTNRRQQAAVHVDLERRQLGEQFRILESAFADPEPSAPNRALIMVLGLMMGLAFGGGVGVLAEGLDPSYHDSREVQNDLGVPVLAAIPRILLEPDIAAARRRSFRMALVASAVVLFSLSGGAATYFFVNGAPRIIRELMTGDEETGSSSTAIERSAGGRL